MKCIKMYSFLKDSVTLKPNILDYPIDNIPFLVNVIKGGVASTKAMCVFRPLLVPLSQIKSSIPLCEKFVSIKEA